MHKIKTKIALAALSVFGALFAFSGTTFAESTNGVISDENDIRWEYTLSDSEPQVLTIKFYDKPSDLGTVTVPSLDYLISHIDGASSDLDTYILENARTSQQDELYPDLTRRDPSVPTTVLDMTDTSKIQIRGVEPIIDPSVMTELIFGENMVIGDTFEKTAYGTRCTYWYYDDWYEDPMWWCYDSEDVRIDDFSTIEGFDELSVSEQVDYQAKAEDFGCILSGEYGSLPPDAEPGDQCYLVREPHTITYFNGGAFAGYKLKLTNFEADRFNYVGYQAFYRATFDESSRSITVEGDSLVGGEIFSYSNVNSVYINTETFGDDMFKGCEGITGFTVSDDVRSLPAGTFSETSIENLDFSTTNIKRIGARAFQNAKVKSVNFEGIERIDYSAFEYNDIIELHLPKSINYLQSNIFYGNKNMKKVIVDYDTLTSGTTLPFFVVVEGYYRGEDEDSPLFSIEEIEVNAPYAEDEEVSPTHVGYEDYKWHYDPYTQEHVTDKELDKSAGNYYGWANYNYYEKIGAEHRSSQFETDFANVDSYKNVVAPIYFMCLHGIKKITVGDGYEFIGSSAFWDMSGWQDFGDTWANVHHVDLDGNYVDWWGYEYNAIESRRIEEVNLPEGLKGVGTQAFEGIWNNNIKINLPKSLEFIGIAAFRRVWQMRNDFDLPNIKYLGDHAFESTMIQNIYLPDTIYYMGIDVFANCPSIHDITIDFDVYDPDLMIAWANEDLAANSNGFMNRFKLNFGEWYGWMQNVSDEDVERWGFNVGNFPYNYSGRFQKFDTITFTDKVVHEINLTKDEERRFSETGDVYFGQMIADKIDMSKTGWKNLPPNMFLNSRVKEVLLPEHLEVIGFQAFNQFLTENEIVIPDSVRIIGDRAFESASILSYRQSKEQYPEYYPEDLETPIIKNLPESLEYIGIEAFWGVDNLTADLYAPNLKYLGIRAFWGTNVRDVTIPKGVTALHEGTFANAPSLRNITIDCDFGAAINGEYDYTFDYPDWMLDWARGNEEYVYRAIKYSKLEDWYSAEYDPEYNHSFFYGADFQTFYTIFNQTMKQSNGYSNDGQATANEHFGTLTFTKNNVTEVDGNIGIFSYFTFDKVDMGEAKWKKMTNAMSSFKKAKIGTLILPKGLETMTQTSFEDAEITEPFELPTTLKKFERGAFQFSKGTITNMLPSSVEEIGNAAFYNADLSDNLVIPASVTKIEWSAFNAGSADVSYDTVQVKNELSREADSNQLVHQLFWKNKIKKLTIESSTLPALELETIGEYNQEFWHMTALEEVVLTNIPRVSYKAFDECTALKKVDFSQNRNLRTIDAKAFAGDVSLDTILFSPDIKNKTVTIGEFAFKDTAFETMGDSTTDFDLTAAKFEAHDGYAFSEMPKLRTVNVPANFSNATVPVATFANDEALTEATISYKVTLIDNAAFSNDEELQRIFIWGNTVVNDENLPGYVAPELGRGGDGDRGDGDSDGDSGYGPTIPETTDIYAYSASLTKDYAGYEGRDDFDSVFYPLDEVLYITSNDPLVLLNEEQDDFDKTGVVLYAMRRDGIILRSDNWGEYNGVAYPRSQSALTFEHMADVIAEDPAFGTVYDTPVPLDELTIGNVNFEEIDYEMVPSEEDGNVRLINVIYTDGYTRNQPDTDIDPYTEGDPIDGPTDPEDDNPIIPDPIEDIIEKIIDGPITTAQAIIGYIVIALLSAGIIVLAVKRTKN